MRRAIDAFLTLIATAALKGFFRGVEVDGRDRIPKNRPVLIVANHFNGFVDPVVLLYVFRRLPRFLAKATLWKVWPARPLLAFAGIIPVYRKEDGDGVTSNTSTFAACHEVLRKQGFVGIFPEGTTHDAPYLSKVRTGAARIALGAMADGVEGITILPVGLTFEDKLALRSRVVAKVGEPIDLDERRAEFVGEGEELSEDNHEAVRRLTDEIHEQLRRVSPDYEDNHERRTLELAAEVTLRSDIESYREEVSLSRYTTLAQGLADASQSARQRVETAVASYNLDLTLAGLRDDQLVPGYSRSQLWRHFVITAVIVVVLFPFMVTGAIVNFIPYWLVKLAGRAPEAPVSKGTMRLLVALGAFGLTWLTYAIWTADGFWGGLFVFFFVAIAGFATVLAFEAVVRVTRAMRGLSNLRNRRSFIEPLFEERAELVASVEAATTD